MFGEAINVAFFLAFDYLEEREAFGSIDLDREVSLRDKLVPDFFSLSESHYL